MHLFRFISPAGPHLGLDTGQEQVDLRAAAPEFASIPTWLASADPIGAIQKAIPAARHHSLIKSNQRLLAPIDNQEVWACGVTYLRSKAARMGESTHEAVFYDRVRIAIDGIGILENNTAGGS